MSSVKLFFQQAATIFTGAVIGNGLLIIFLPILTNLYSIESVGIYGFLMAATASLIPLATGKIEQAIVVGKDNETFPLVLSATLLIVLIVCLTLFGISVFENIFVNNTIFDFIANHHYIFAIAIIFYSSQILLEGVANRNSNYGSISAGRILTPLVFISLAIISPINDYSAIDLIISYAIAPALSVIYLLYSNIDKIRFHSKDIFSKMFLAVFNHKKFITISSPTSFLDNLAASSPIYLLGIFHSPQLVAFYTLALRIGYGPLSVIARSLSQVNLRTISNIHQAGKKPIKQLKKLMKPFIYFVLLAFSATFIIDDLIIIIFGDEWAMAGHILRILFPIFLFKFFVSSFSSTLEATGFIILASLWKLIAIIVIPSSIYILNLFFDPIGIFKGLAATEFILYIIYLCMILYAASEDNNIRKRELI